MDKKDKHVNELYKKDKDFHELIDYAVDTILTDIVVDEHINIELFSLLYDITDEQMFIELYNILKYIRNNNTCPVCKGKLKFSGCPILVCKKCKREFVLYTKNIIKLCDYCISNQTKLCTMRKTFKETIKDKEDSQWHQIQI